MRIASDIAILLLLISMVGCIQPSSSTESKMPSAQWDYGRISGYLANVPGIRAMTPWEYPHGQGLCIQTRHYRIYTTLADPLMLRQVPGFVESAYQAYCSQLPDAVDDSIVCDTYLFADRQQWEQFTRGFTGADAEVYLQIKEGAYALRGVCVAYDIGRKQTFSVLGHEGWHQFTERHFRYRLPSWLDEGVATLFETCRYEGGRFVFEPQKNLMRLGNLKEARQAGRVLRLQELIEINPGQTLDGRAGGESSALTFYAQAYALVRFLREEDYGRHLANYQKMLLGGLRGTWPIAPELTRFAADRSRPLTVGWNAVTSPILFQMYIGKDLPSIEQQYNGFCSEIVYYIRTTP